MFYMGRNSIADLWGVEMICYKVHVFPGLVGVYTVVCMDPVGQVMVFADQGLLGYRD